MTTALPRLVALAASALLAVTMAPVPAVGAAGAAAIAPDAARVVARCVGGPGRVSVTVLPRTGGSARVTVVARRLADNDALWRAELIAFTRTGEEVETTFLRRPVDGSWSFSTRVQFEKSGAATFVVAARSAGRRGETTCLVGNSPTRPVGAISSCGRGLHLLVLRPQDDGTLAVAHALLFVAPRSRWQFELTIERGDSGEAFGYSDVTNGRGVIRTRLELGDLAAYQEARFTATAENRHGRRCWIRMNPGTLTTDGADAPLARPLVRRAGSQI